MLTTGELARRVGVTTRTVRFYEEKGFITRTEKKFSEEAYVILEKIKLLQEAGFRLEEIEEVFRHLQEKPTTSRQRQQACERLLSDTHERLKNKINKLTELSSHIEDVLQHADSCRNCTAEDCGACSRLSMWRNFGYQDELRRE